MKHFFEDETYIKMCRKADLVPEFEIKLIGYTVPGIVWQDGNCFYNERSIVMPSNNDKLIWLPRQDQLQNIVITEAQKRYKHNEEKRSDLFQSHELLEGKFYDFVHDYDRLKFFHIART